MKKIKIQRYFRNVHKKINRALSPKKFVRKKLKQFYKLPRLIRLGSIAIFILLFVGGGVAGAQLINKSLSKTPLQDGMQSQNEAKPSLQQESTSDSSSTTDPGSETSTSATPDSSSKCVTSDIAYRIIEQPTDRLEKGRVEIVQQGVKGKKQTCTDASGKKTEKILVQPVTKVVDVGTRERQTNTSNPEPAPQYTQEEINRASLACTAKGKILEPARSECIADELKTYR